MRRLASWVLPGVASWLRKMPDGTEVDVEWIYEGEERIGITIKVL